MSDKCYMCIYIYGHVASRVNLARSVGVKNK